MKNIQHHEEWRYRGTRKIELNQARSKSDPVNICHNRSNRYTYDADLYRGRWDDQLRGRLERRSRMFQLRVNWLNWQCHCACLETVGRQWVLLCWQLLIGTLSTHISTDQLGHIYWPFEPADQLYKYQSYLIQTSDPVSASASASWYHLQSAAHGDLALPRSETTRYGQRSCSVSGRQCGTHCCCLFVTHPSLTLMQFCIHLKTFCSD